MEKGIDLCGYSQGGLSALDFAAVAGECGIKVNNVVCIDNPGGKNFGDSKVSSFFGITRAFLEEGRDLPYYSDDPNDPVQREVSNVSKNKPEGLKKVVKNTVESGKLIKGIIMDGKRMGKLTAYPYAMSKETVNKTLEKILDNPYGPTITFILGTKSLISDRNSLYELRKKLSDDQKSRMKLNILPGDSHALGERGRRMSWFILNALNGGVNKR